MLNLKFGRLDGKTDNEVRDDIVNRFNAEVSEILPVALNSISDRVHGYCLRFRLEPSAYLQAMTRIQRIGQKRTVHVMRLVLEGSIDGCIVEVGLCSALAAEPAKKAEELTHANTEE